MSNQREQLGLIMLQTQLGSHSASYRIYFDNYYSEIAWKFQGTHLELCFK